MKERRKKVIVLLDLFGVKITKTDQHNMKKNKFVLSIVLTKKIIFYLCTPLSVAMR
jgi:hypothetical protein